MKKRVLCILTALMMVFCLSSSYFAGIIATADGETYKEITSSTTRLTSGTYKLTDDVTVKNTLTVASGEDVTIDLNGYTISTSTTDRVIHVNTGTLTLIDSSEDGKGSVVQNHKGYYAVRVSGNGTLNMCGGNISGPIGVYVYKGTANITSGTITGTETYAIQADEGAVTISGNGKVNILASNESDKTAYGVYHKYAVTVTISNPNTYVRSESSSAAAIEPVTKVSTKAITAGYYSTDVSNYVPDGYECVESGISDYPYVVKAKTLMPELYGNSLTLDGEVGVTYYFDMTGQENPDIYTLQVQIEGEEETRTVAAIEPKTVDEIYCYRYTVYVNPDQFGSTIYATLTDGTNSSETIEYSVETYCMYAISTEGWEPEAELCKAILNYGYYASLYNGKECINSLSGVSGWTDPVVGEWTANLSEYSGTETNGVSKALILGSSVVIRLYIEKGTTESSDVFTFDDSVLERYSVTDDNYEYYVEFKVPAKEMVNTQTVLKNGEEFTSYSVLSYVYNALKSDKTSDNLSNLCKAIYYYSVAAYNYTGWR